MIVYIIYIFFLILLAYLCLYSKQPKAVIFLMLFTIFIFTAFRDGIGVDTVSYQEAYKSIKTDGGESMYFEKGYLAINKLAYALGDHYVIVQMLCVGISLFFMFLFLKYSLPLHLIGFGLVAMVCSILYLSYLCSGVRQGLAVCVCLFSSRYIVRREFLKFALTVGFAMLFHNSAIIFLPAYFIYSKRLKFSFVVVAFLISFFSAPLVKIAFDSLITQVTGHYMGYATIMNGDANSKSGLGIILRIIVWIIISFLFLKYKSSKSNESNIYFNLFVIGVCFYLLNRNVNILNRLNDFYLSFFYVVFPLSMRIFEYKSRKIFLGLSSFVLVCLFLSFVLFVKDSFIPYKSYLLSGF